MNHIKVLLTALLAASGFAAQAAQAASNWVGTANYRLAPGSTGDEDIVGPFDTYDAAPGVVLLKPTGTTGSGSSTFDGYYQSYITNHALAGTVVSSPGLNAGANSTYELTAVASFTESVTAAGAISVTGGNFSIYLDTHPDYNFGGDSGFTDGDSILSGKIISGTGTAMPDFSFGVTDITFQVTSFNAAVYSPASAISGGGIFTLRLNNPADAGLLDPIHSVMGNTIGPNDLKYAADGYITLAVPEAHTYAMMLAGLALVGFMSRRNSRFSV